jgi:hypothetical protein
MRLAMSNLMAVFEQSEEGGECQQLRLPIKDRDIFIQTLLNPPKSSNKLSEAAKKYRKDVISK